MQTLIFWFEFHWSMFIKVQLIIAHIGWGNGFVAEQEKAITRIKFTDTHTHTHMHHQHHIRRMSYVVLASPQDHFNIKAIFLGTGIPIIKIRWSHGHFICIMGIPTLVRQHFYTETPPRASMNWWQRKFDDLEYITQGLTLYKAFGLHAHRAPGSKNLRALQKFQCAQPIFVQVLQSLCILLRT